MEIGLIITILVVVLGFIIFLFIHHLISQNKKNSEIKKIIETRVFLVTLPKDIPRKETEHQAPMPDFRQIISVAEQMFASLASLYSADLKNQILRDQDQVSFEIVAKDGVISFYVACPHDHAEMLEKQIQASYPNANLTKVRNPNIFDLPEGQGDFAAAELKLEKKFVLPIRTYMSLESDSLSAITNAMSKLGENANAAYQVLIKPANASWRGAVTGASRKVQEGKSIASDPWYIKTINQGSNSIADAIHSQGSSGDSGHEPKPPVQLTPIQENQLQSLGSKVAKTGFETAIRVVTAAPDKTTALNNLQAITSSFSQFGSPELNSFKVKTGSAGTVKNYILRRFSKKGFIFNTEELASIFHFPNINIDTPNIHWLLAKEMAAPANMPTDGVILGKNIYRDVETLVRLKDVDRQKHLFMIGKTGTGKTTLFTNMIEQDMANGKGCCFLDPNGDAVEDILGKIPPHRFNDVILFDPSDAQFPMGLNMLEFKKPEERDFLIQECIEIFYKLFDPNRTGMVGAQWEHWFRNAALTVMSQPDGGTLIDIPRLFTDDAFRNACVSYVQDPIVRAFWEEQLAKTADFHKSEMYNYFISKFGRFMTNDMMRNIIGQKKSSFDFRQAMDSGKIILVNISKGKVGEMNSSLLGMIIVTRIQVSAFSRADIPEDDRRDFYLYVDEFQNFTTDSFRTILSEARKYHLNLNVANQYIAQLTDSIRDAVLGNAGTMISYRIGAPDAEYLVKEFPGVSPSDFTNLDKFNTYTKLLIDGTPSKPFSMKGIKSPVESSTEVREKVRQLSRQTYGRPVAEVNQSFTASLKVGHNQPPSGVNEPIRNL